eukprot:CAMPEP_0197048038 /NCGR_PEP_ID=MMETSP1384-20130603/23444_1 /TAXON_ID=29189 /ORGANISM="Ammonia sp." /LENGTH=615 /DNA_ID=CAMNT_0042480083 /DNA_START=192 /DNA_END=2039 /DNA_ORIENTATION=-
MLHLVWLALCVVMFVMTRQLSNAVWNPSIYDIGFFLYLLCGSIIVLFICIKLNRNIQESIHKLSDIQQSTFENYVYDDNNNNAAAGVQHMQMEQHLDTNSPATDECNTAPSSSPVPPYDIPHTLTMKQVVDSTSNHLPPKQPKPDQVLNPLHKIAALHQARYKVNAAIAVAIAFAISSMCAAYWTARTISTTKPFASFLINFAFLFMLYIVIIVYQWTASTPKQTSVSTCCQRATASVSSSSHLSQHMHTSDGVPTTRDDEEENSVSFAKQKLKRRSIEPVNSPTSAVMETDGERPQQQEIVEFGSADKLTLTLAENSVVSYTDMTVVKLPKDMLHVDLSNLDSHGEVVGKRGKSKPSRQRKDAPTTSKHAQTIEIYRKRHSKAADSLNLNDRHSVSVLDMQNDDMSRNTMTANHHSLQIDEFLEDVLDVIEAPPITVIVFEFADVLCTQIEKVKGELQKDQYLQSKQLVQKQLYFGGAQRVEFMAQWLKELKRDNKDLRCFVNTEQESQSIAKLMQDVGLLAYFVSRNANNPNRLISHVIGHDHKISRQSEWKKHLVLLELMQFLNTSHECMLYVGNDTHVIEHLNKIQICQTYHVAAKGLTEMDLDVIKRNYF